MKKIIEWEDFWVREYGEEREVREEMVERWCREGGSEWRKCWV